ncbi:PC4 and SFRS1-interacting protein isoform X2 [Eupeodes corollae]|uniref:PC4 and SFRS1-interacting protein isoform X2 n=1 Tax=Eupeodes corollae TaxID=290404 RepID=UPI00248FF3FE|nr:PC4 and SFRS1-interacting protein isoform X2 [Eupeodes corollae]
MGKKDKSFNIGDLVFAKVKGYPPWPAKITKTNNKKYSVYFYGTGETANIKIEDLFNYKDSKNKFATDKNLKRAHFREAIAQIEAALEGEDSAPINLEELDASVVGQSDAAGAAAAGGGNDTTIATDLDETNALDETVAEEADEVMSAATTAVAAAADETVDEIATEAEVAEEQTVAADVKPAVEEAVSSSTSPAPDAAKGTPETELVSRSGRKIKPKRYMDEEEVPQNPSKRLKAETKKKRLMDSNNSISIEIDELNSINDENDDITDDDDDDDNVDAFSPKRTGLRTFRENNINADDANANVINIEEDEEIHVKTDASSTPIINIAEKGYLFDDNDVELTSIPMSIPLPIPIPLPVQSNATESNGLINLKDEDFLLITDENPNIQNIVNMSEMGFISKAHAALNRTPSSRKSTPRQRRKKPSQDDAYIAIMREKTKVLKELASTSTVLNAAYNLESPDKTITQQYFDVYSAEIELLPNDLRLKCQREVHQAVTDIIHKFQDQAVEMKRTRSCRKLVQK